MMDEALRLYHVQSVEVWENFCKLHRDLFELTCEEYQALLSGEIEQLEDMIVRKEAVMADIAIWETRRADLVTSLNNSGATDVAVNSISDLLRVMRGPEATMAIPALTNLNALLIDIITQTQAQNKRNQIFLNKAMLNLRDIREGFGGKKTYTTYGANGMTRSAGK